MYMMREREGEKFKRQAYAHILEKNEEDDDEGRKDKIHLIYLLFAYSF